MNRIALATALCALVPAAALAHAHLKTAVPAADATVTAAPAEVAIDFTEAVEPRFSTIEVTSPTGVRVDAGPAHVAPTDGKHLAVSVQPLQPGIYTVHWHATAVDTHKTEGEFRFTVAAGG